MRIVVTGGAGFIGSAHIGHVLEKHPANEIVVRNLLRLLGKPEELLVYVPDRPGLDRRYALDASKIEREVGWEPVMDFKRMMRETVAWYQAHPAWWQAVRDDDASFADYYQGQYGRRLAEGVAS